MSVALAQPRPAVIRLVSGPAAITRSPAGRARTAAIDALTLLAVVVCIPFAMMLVGLPVVLVLQLLLRLARLL